MELRAWSMGEGETWGRERLGEGRRESGKRANALSDGDDKPSKARTRRY
jgi:hypothetical protein